MPCIRQHVWSSLLPCTYRLLDIKLISFHFLMSLYRTHIAQHGMNGEFMRCSLISSILELELKKHFSMNIYGWWVGVDRVKRYSYHHHLLLLLIRSSHTRFFDIQESSSTQAIKLHKLNKIYGTNSIKNSEFNQNTFI